MNNLKFATKILLVILGVSLISMITVSTISYTELLHLSGYSQDVNIQLGFYASDNSKGALVQQAEAYMSRLAASQAADCDGVLLAIQNNITSLSLYMEELYKRPGNFQGRRLPLPYEVQAGVPTAKMMVAQSAAITPAIESEMRLVSNAEFMFGSIFKANPNMDNTYLGTVTGINFRYSNYNTFNPAFDPRTRPWYIAAYNADGPIWLDTYVDPYGVICTTCAQTYKNANGNIIGVVATDILLSTMVDDILSMRIGETGYAFLLDNNGRYLAHPHYNDLDPNALENAQGGYKDVLTSMAAGESDVRQAVINDTNYYIAYAPLPVTGWSLGIAVEFDEIISGALLMKSNIDNQALETKEQIRSMLNSVMFRFIVLTCIIIIAVLILSILVSGSVTKPMIQLTNSVIEVGKGNLDSKIDINTKDEIGVLANCFNKMTDDLKVYISNLSKVTAEKERIGAELNVATNIQASMLPCIFPAFPEHEEFDIYASMRPAKEVGGDFYDLFLVDKDTLAILIADVSGKGVPAALFMVIAKTLIKNNAQNGLSPKDVFDKVNNLLCANNNEGMFVTAFMGYLDIPSGRLTCVNAGHNPPLLLKDNSFRWVKIKRGLVLGGMEDMRYKEETLTLEKGEMIFLYTDGVTEALNPENELFSEARLMDIADKSKNGSLKEFTVSVKTEIDAFARGAEQADDITMLVMKYKGGAKKELIIDAVPENNDAVVNFVNTELEAIGCPVKTRNQIAISIEEIFVNIAHYAYNPEVGTARICVTISGGVLQLVFEDSGKPYNPLERVDPDVTASVDERKIGGLGVFMVKKMMDTVEYRYEDGKNRLTMTKVVK